MATTKTLYEKVIEVFPELIENQSPFHEMKILICNDVDGTPDYIAKWEYSKPLPDSLASYLR